MNNSNSFSSAAFFPLILPPSCTFTNRVIAYIYHFTVAFIRFLRFVCVCVCDCFLPHFFHTFALSPCTFGNLFLVAWCNFCCYWRRLFTDSWIRNRVVCWWSRSCSRHKCRSQKCTLALSRSLLSVRCMWLVTSSAGLFRAGVLCTCTLV